MPVTYQSSQTNPFAANYRGATTPQSSQTNPYAANYQGSQSSLFRPASSKVLGASTTGAGITGGGATQGAQAPAGNTILEQDINRSTGDMSSIIDRDFESALSELGAQEQNLRGSADVATQQIQAQGNQARGAIGQQKETNLQGIQSQEQTAQTQSQSALQQARDLYKQIQSQNVAQLSGMGISSSSVTEALAERLGVETARRIAGVTGSRDEILNNLQAERTRINTVAQQKLAELEQTIGAQISEVQNNLLAGLRQVNSARNVASNDRSNRRAELLSNAQSQIAQLKASAANFQQQLQMAAEKRQASLQESLNLLTSTPEDFSTLTSNINAISPALQGAGLQFSNVTPKGTFSIGPAKVSKQDDELESLL